MALSNRARTTTGEVLLEPRHTWSQWSWWLLSLKASQGDMVAEWSSGPENCSWWWWVWGTQSSNRSVQLAMSHFGVGQDKTIARTSCGFIKEFSAQSRLMKIALTESCHCAWSTIHSQGFQSHPNQPCLPITWWSLPEVNLLRWEVPDCPVTVLLQWSQAGWEKHQTAEIPIQHTSE